MRVTVRFDGVHNSVAKTAVGGTSTRLTGNGMRSESKRGCAISACQVPLISETESTPFVSVVAATVSDAISA